MATMPRAAETEVIRRTDAASPYADWSAIFAGAAVAAAISMMLVAFGSAIGLSLTSMAGSSAAPGVGIVIAVGLWLVWLQVTASFGGGYVAGRLRRRIGDSQRHETEMRDGMHGLVVWAIGVLLGSLIAAWIATLGTVGAAAVGSGAAANPRAADMTGYYADRLLRTGNGAQAAAPAQGADQSRAEIGRLLATGRVTSADSEDRTWLIQQVMQRTGLSEQDATQRVDQTVAAMKSAADHARKLAVLMAFITVVSLVLSALASWWAATKGGSHRDEAVDHSRFTSWR